MKHFPELRLGALELGYGAARDLSETELRLVISDASPDLFPACKYGRCTRRCGCRRKATEPSTAQRLTSSDAPVSGRAAPVGPEAIPRVRGA